MTRTDRLRTTTLPPKDLVSPCTSTATAPLPVVASSLRMADALCRLQGDRNRLAHAQILRALRGSLDAEDEASPLLLAVDDGRGELRLGRDEVDPRCQPTGAAVAADPDGVADMHGGQGRLRHEEPHAGIVRRQQRQDRPP